MIEVMDILRKYSRRNQFQKQKRANFKKENYPVMEDRFTENMLLYIAKTSCDQANYKPKSQKEISVTTFKKPYGKS